MATDATDTFFDDVEEYLTLAELGSGSGAGPHSPDDIPLAGSILKANEKEFVFVGCVVGAVLVLCCIMWCRYSAFLRKSGPMYTDILSHRPVLESQARLLQ